MKPGLERTETVEKGQKQGRKTRTKGSEGRDRIRRTGTICTLALCFDLHFNRGKILDIF